MALKSYQHLCPWSLCNITLDLSQTFIIGYWFNGRFWRCFFFSLQILLGWQKQCIPSYPIHLQHVYLKSYFGITWPNCGFSIILHIVWRKTLIDPTIIDIKLIFRFKAFDNLPNLVIFYPRLKHDFIRLYAGEELFLCAKRNF